MIDSYFIKVPKTGGTSVVRSLETVTRVSYRFSPYGTLPDLKGLVFYKVGRPEEISEASIAAKDFMDRAFKFCFVRNPWDRLVSLYFYIMDSKRRGEEVASWKEVPDDRIDTAMTFGTFCERVCLHPIVTYSWNMREGLSICNPQTHWILDKNGKVFPNFVGRFENLEKDFATVCDKLGVDLKLPEEHYNKTKHDPYSVYYNEETKAMVAKKYSKDINMFGYKFNG